MRILQDLAGVLRQSNISRRNIAWAESLTVHRDQDVCELASIVAEVGRIHPHPRRRYVFLHRHHPVLFERMVAAGVLEPWIEYEYADADLGAAPDDLEPMWLELDEFSLRGTSSPEPTDEDLELPF